MRKTSITEDWLRLSTATTFLWMESVAVVWLRGALILSRDPTGRREAVRMVTEKFEANVELATKFATQAPRTPREAALLSVNHYGARVRANRKRLLDRRLARKIAGT